MSGNDMEIPWFSIII